MPIDNHVGYGECTEIKNTHFRTLIQINLKMWKSYMQEYGEKTFTYWDINAGPGFHEAFGKGSPIIFLEEIKNVGMNYCANFLEKDPATSEKLKYNILMTYGQDAANVWQGDHNVTLRTWIDNQGFRFLPGLLYSDPTGEEPPFDLIAEFSKHWRKVDLLIYVSATNIKRKIPYGCCRLLESINKIDKKHCMIRKPMDAFQWTFLYLTNGPIPVWKKQGFYDILSKEGNEIIERLNLTNEERERQYQLSLFQLS
jgi:three-Cys-motif partner protein